MKTKIFYNQTIITDHEMNSAEEHVDESKKVTEKCRSNIGPNKGSKYVITKLNGSMGKDVESPGYSRKCKFLIMICTLIDARNYFNI
jgi:hypothetical protein